MEGRLAELVPVYVHETWGAWLQLLAIAVASALSAWVVWWILKFGATKVVGKTKTEVDDRLLEAAHWPLWVSVFLIGLRMGVARLQLADLTEQRIVDALQTVALLFWVVAALRASGVLLRALARRRSRGALVSRHTEPLFENLAKVAIVILGAYLVINAWGADVSGLLAAGGIAGLAVGFAARDTLANLFAGIFIFADGPYKIGDFITLDTGERGMVTEIGIRSTRLLTRDDIEVTIPNAVMGNAKINNESGGPHVKYRIRVRVGVAYTSDVEKVEALQLQVADDNEKVCKEPTPRVRFRGFGPSSIDYELLCWVEEPVLRGIVTHELVKATIKAFAEAGIEIPYSKHDIYIKEGRPSRQPRLAEPAAD
ncbi:MAG: mechanosensitive ion channel family protein [Holophagales bacterium]|nr:mechanosensitive ion channel family protein [Holophagales bacterium]MYJ27110.1 mechanosensitive ion channel family protein [Holophagales bacterium]